MKIHNMDQRSDAWFAIRAGKPTASEFSSIVTSAGKPIKSRVPYARTLAAEVIGGPGVNQWGGNMDLERGKFLEDEARKHYAFLNGVDVVEVGFLTDDDETIGCSPDGLVGDEGGIEIKCLNAKNHIDAIMRWRDDQETPPDYIAQTQGALWISGRAWWDLVFYHYALPPLVIRQFPNPEFFAALAEGVTEVIAERDRVVAVLNELHGVGIGSEWGEPSDILAAG